MLNSSARKALQHARWSKGWTLERLSAEADVSIKTIVEIEKGRTEPFGHTVHKLAKALDLDATELLDEVAS